MPEPEQFVAILLSLGAAAVCALAGAIAARAQWMRNRTAGLVAGGFGCLVAGMMAIPGILLLAGWGHYWLETLRRCDPFSLGLAGGRSRVDPSESGRPTARALAVGISVGATRLRDRAVLTRSYGATSLPDHLIHEDSFRGGPGTGSRKRTEKRSLEGSPTRFRATSEPVLRKNRQGPTARSRSTPDQMEAGSNDAVCG